jgi:hypothetical protein
MCSTTATEPLSENALSSAGITTAAEPLPSDSMRRDLDQRRVAAQGSPSSAEL